MCLRICVGLLYFKNTSICACSLEVSSNLRRYFYFEDISCFQYLYFISPGEALQGRKNTEGHNIFIREVECGVYTEFHATHKRWQLPET